MSQERYVDESIQDSIHETQIDATADSATFVGIVGGDADPTSVPTTVDVRIELPSGRTADVPVSVPAASDWEGSLISQLLTHLHVTDPSDLDEAVDKQVPIVMEGEKPKIDSQRLTGDSGFDVPSLSPISGHLALTEKQADLLLISGFGGSLLAQAFAGDLVNFILLFLFGGIAMLIGALFVTPYIESGNS